MKKRPTVNQPFILEDDAQGLPCGESSPPAPGCVKPSLLFPEVSTIVFEKENIDIIDIRLGKATASASKVFGRIEIDMAKQLAPLPADLHVVFLIDASYSMGFDGVSAELDALLAFMSHVPDAKFDIVVYRRSAERVLKRFVEAKEIPVLFRTPRIENSIYLGNGSAMDDGYRLAPRYFATSRAPITSWPLPIRCSNRFGRIGPCTGYWTEPRPVSSTTSWCPPRPAAGSRDHHGQ